MQKEETSKRFKKYNIYDLTGEYGIGYTSKGEEFYFDLEDYDKIKDYCWYIDNGYVVNGCNIRLHRLITDCPDDNVVDHIHGKKSRNDNRKSNLRICTQQLNTVNKSMQSNNTSGVIGVYWEKSCNKWRAYINFNKKRKSLGCYNDFNDAVKAREEAEEKYFGEYAYKDDVL